MKRRSFIAALGSAAVWPLLARAQHWERVPRIGYLGLSSASSAGLAAFKAGLRDLGYVESRNLQIEFRFAEGAMERLPGLAADLVGLNVDVIVTYATGVFAAQHATRTIPIVMASAGDVVALGTVASLARPGGNITGLTFFLPELMAKRLALLKEVVPTMTKAGVLLLRNNPSTSNILETMGGTARALRVELQPAELLGPSDLERAFSVWDDEQVGGIVMIDHEQVLAHANTIAALTKKYGIPSIGPLELPANGGLVGYGVNFSDMFRRAATFVDKILKGTKPGDIPVEQATKFKLVLNLKAARAFGIDLPPSLLARADEVIE